MAVALHVRAWIETKVTKTGVTSKPVALHVRAWIETISQMGTNLNAKSPSM